MTWDPPLCGDIDIIIKANGDWYHEGVKFTRQPLIKLFASILKKEGDEYFLVSPVEKWKITVEESPLHVTGMELIENISNAQEQCIQFITSTDDVFFLDIDHPLRVLSKNYSEELKPYIIVRNNLEALLNRNIFYRLAEMSVLHEGKYGVWSGGVFFALE